MDMSLIGHPYSVLVQRRLCVLLLSVYLCFGHAPYYMALSSCIKFIFETVLPFFQIWNWIPVSSFLLHSAVLVIFFQFPIPEPFLEFYDFSSF